MKISFLDHKHNCVFVIIGKISTSYIDIYAFIDPMNKKVPYFYYYPKDIK